MTVTSLIYKINADATGFSREFRGAEKDVRRFSRRAKSNMAKVGQAFKIAGGLAVTSMAAMVKETVNTASEMSFVAERTGIAVEEISGLAYAAGQSDIELGKLDGRLQRFNRQIGDAADGTGTTAEMMRRLNISLRDDSGIRSQVDLLGDVADAIANAKDGYEETAIAAEFFGRRGGPELLPLLRQGKDGIEELKDEAERLGIVITGDTAAAARQFEDDLARLKSRGRGLAIQFGSNVIPVIGEYANILAESATEQGGLNKEISKTAKAAAFVMKAIEGVRASFLVVGKTIGAVLGDSFLAVKSFGNQIKILGVGIGDVFKSLLNRDVDGARQAARRMQEAGLEEQERALAGRELAARGHSKEMERILTESAARMAALDDAAAGTASTSDPDDGRDDGSGGPLRRMVSEAETEYNRLADLTSRAQQDMRTPLEQWGDDLADLQAAWALGIIDGETFDALKQNLEESLDPWGEFAAAAEKAKRAMDMKEETKAISAALDEEAREVIASINGIDLATVAHLESLQELAESGRISWGQYDTAVQMASKGMEEANDKMKETNELVEDFEDIGNQAVGMLSSSIADAFVDPLNASFEDMAVNFIKQVNRMVIQTIVQRAILAGVGRMGFSEGGAVQSFATGGPVFGAGTATSDSIPAYLSNGEYVLNAATTQRIGVNNLDAVNFGNAHGFATGGAVSGGGGAGGVKIVFVQNEQQARLEFARSKPNEDVTIRQMRDNERRF